MKLGEVLISKGLIKEEQLKKALELQNSNPGKKLGEILVEAGFITQSVLDNALK